MACTRKKRLIRLNACLVLCSPEDFQHEEFLVSKAIGLAFHHLNLGIGAFQGPSGDAAIVPSHDNRAMQSHSPCGLLQPCVCPLRNNVTFLS